MNATVEKIKFATKLKNISFETRKKLAEDKASEERKIEYQKHAKSFLEEVLFPKFLEEAKTTGNEEYTYDHDKIGKDLRSYFKDIAHSIDLQELFTDFIIPALVMQGFESITLDKLNYVINWSK